MLTIDLSLARKAPSLLRALVALERAAGDAAHVGSDVPALAVALGRARAVIGSIELETLLRYSIRTEES